MMMMTVRPSSYWPDFSSSPKSQGGKKQQHKHKSNINQKTEPCFT